MKKIAILSYSGGIISSTTLLSLLKNEEYSKVYALFFNYDNQAEIEKKSADLVINYLEDSNYKDKLEYNKLMIKVNEKASEVISKMEDSDKVSVKELFLNYDALVSLAEKLTEDDSEVVVDIHIGLNYEMDFDTSESYSIAYKSIESRLSDRITFKADYEKYTKQDAIRNGQQLLLDMGLDFNTFYRRTNTTPRTIKIGNKLFADATDPKSSERVLAFYQLGITDPVKYAKDGEILTWDEVVELYGGNTIKDEFGNSVIEEIKESEPIKKVEEKKPISNKKEDPVFEPESPHKSKAYVAVTIVGQ